MAHVSELPAFDKKFEQYLNSGKCPVWDTEKPLYRGGAGYHERKFLRDLEKEKIPFRQDLIEVVSH